MQSRYDKIHENEDLLTTSTKPSNAMAGPIMKAQYDDNLLGTHVLSTQSRKQECYSLETRLVGRWELSKKGYVARY